MSPAGDVIPLGLRPPQPVALAKPVKGFPLAAALPGQMLFEPKFDGYRVLIFREKERTSLWSRRNKDLTRYFPDLESAAAAMIPASCVVDGEAVVWSDGTLDFEALQRRLSAGKARLAAMVRAFPATFVGFDVLGVAGHDAGSLPFMDRRALLEELASVWAPPLSLSPQTADRNLALQWFDGLTGSGLEGIVAKSSLQSYIGGKRIWLDQTHRGP